MTREPLLDQRPAPTSDRDSAARGLHVNDANLALGHEVFEAAGATFVRDKRFPDIHDANHVTHVSASTPDEIDSLLRRVEREYAHCKHRKFHTDFTTPPQLEARLALEGYEPTDALVMLLEGRLRAEPKPHDIRSLDDDAGWRAFDALHALDWQEHATRAKIEAPATVGEALAATQRLKSPPVRVFLAYVDGEPAGYFNAWEGIDGVGQVENLFVHPAYRHRGVATALIAHCVEDARAHGAGPVVIVSDPTDTPKHMYAALGFRPVALKRGWLKRLGD